MPFIATVFDHPPTIDIGLSFDLRKIPAYYYKYLTILPRCLDSLGLVRNGERTSYSQLLSNVHNQMYAFSIGYDDNPVSGRADLVIRASSANAEEFRASLSLISEMIRFTDLNVSNADRLRDLVSQRISADDLYTKRDGWITNPTYSFRYQQNAAYFAVHSQLTRAHWDERLKWRLHKKVPSQEIEQLAAFANGILASISGISRHELSLRLSDTKTTGLKAELLEYWRKNLYSFSEAELDGGLRQLSAEVQQDLRIGPAKTVADIKRLQTLVLNRNVLHVDLTLSQSMLATIRPELVHFLRSLPAYSRYQSDEQAQELTASPILSKLNARYGPSGEIYPSYVGLVNADAIAGNVIFYSDFPGYLQLDRESLMRVLSSQLLAGSGPQSIYAKTVETGLAYDDGIVSRPGLKILWFYANRTLDIPALMMRVNSVAEHLPDLSDPFLVDYAFRQTFSIPRFLSSFSQRGRAMAIDIRDGNSPDKIRRFSQALLSLRQEPNLLSDLIRDGLASIGAVLLDEKYKNYQRSSRSLFFFAGPEKVLSDIEQRLSIPKLQRLWPSDFWRD